ncbi:prepilin-type N-terminal cleavage/methylation domain-containing protein [bacterium]|nr:prepilin-type N-terminal cleavage/methylation domain-containing protein [bacterium]
MKRYSISFKNEKGFTLTEIIVVLIIVSILATAALSRFIDMSKAANRAACKVNQLSLQTAQTLLNAKSLIENGESHYASDLNELKPFLRKNLLPSCPSGGSYVIGANGSIFCTIPDHNRE